MAVKRWKAPPCLGKLTTAAARRYDPSRGMRRDTHNGGRAKRRGCRGVVKRTGAQECERGEDRSHTGSEER